MIQREDIIRLFSAIRENDQLIDQHKEAVKTLRQGSRDALDSFADDYSISASSLEYCYKKWKDALENPTKTKREADEIVGLLGVVIE